MTQGGRLVTRRWVDGFFISSQFADNVETVAPGADGLVGRIPPYRIWDLAARYRIDGSVVVVFGTVKNVLDARYIASRAPLGIEPGHARQINLGLRYAF